MDDPEARELIVRAAPKCKLKRDDHIAAVMVAWFSQQMTVSPFEWSNVLERRKEPGKPYAYRRKPDRGVASHSSRSSGNSVMRSSQTHPLRIAEIPVGQRGGAIGITFCPGKCGPSLRGHPWVRDLAADLDVIVGWGASCVITLVEQHELDSLGVARLGHEIRARGIEWHHLPIADEQAPDARFERVWDQVGKRIGDSLAHGGKLLVHCRGGLGRAGTVAARMLIDAGEPSWDAVARVRRARPGAIETQEQLDYLGRLKPGLTAQSAALEERKQRLLARAANWFERLFGFRETSYEVTRAQFELDGRQLRSRVNGRSFSVGALELASLGELRQRAMQATGRGGAPSKVSIVRGDVKWLHQQPEYARAVFQVASQFNLLEMADPAIRPEDGVARYQGDGTQGPACAIAAGAATVYRNYFVPLGDGFGQTSARQLDALADMAAELSRRLEVPAKSLWKMRNGYAECTSGGLQAISDYLTRAGTQDFDILRDALRIGVQWDVEVTEGVCAPGPLVTQAFCSALPVKYYPHVPAPLWESFARLVLEAAYEATVCAGVVSVARGGSGTVLLTRLGGGVFGNPDPWIDDAMRRALLLTAGRGLDIRIVSYGEPSAELRNLVREFSGQKERQGRQFSYGSSG